jgi:hypothetical protein
VTGAPSPGAPSSGPPLAPVTLDGRHVRLEPLEDRHVDALWAAGQDPALWTLALARMATRDDMHRYVDAALDERAAARPSRSPWSPTPRPAWSGAPASAATIRGTGASRSAGRGWPGRGSAPP